MWQIPARGAIGKVIMGRMGQNLGFGGALVALRDGGKVARTGWNGQGMYVALSPGFELIANRVYCKPIRDEIGDGTGSFRPYLMLRTTDGEFVPWVATQSDLLADDWFEV